MKDGEFLKSLVESFCRDQFRTYSEVGESRLPADSQLTPSGLPADSQRTPSRLPADSQQIPSGLPGDSLQIMSTQFRELIWRAVLGEPF